MYLRNLTHSGLVRFVETFGLTGAALPAAESSQGLIARKGLLAATLEFSN